MKKSRDIRFLDAIYKFLLALLICFAAALIGGTVYTLFFKRAVPEPAVIAPDRIFTGIGRQRLLTAGGNSAGSRESVVILSITFPYAPEDRAFTEELAARVGEFRSVTEKYFRALNAADLEKKGEEKIKTELLDQFNGILRLGKIETLYFNDFMMLE